jgi:hypothetical protein
MNIVQGTFPLLVVVAILEFYSYVNCSGDRHKKRDKPRSGSIGNEKSRRARSISIVDVKFGDDSYPARVPTVELEREESCGSLNELTTGISRLRPNIGTFDSLPTRFHILAPLKPTKHHEIGDYNKLFPDSPSPINLKEGRRQMKKNSNLNLNLKYSSSSSFSSSSSSSSSSSDEEKKKKQRRRGNSKGSLISEKKHKKKNKKKDKKK